MKKLLPLLVTAAILLSGCGEAAAPSAGGSEATIAEQTPQTPELVGAWKQSNSKSDQNYQQATITTDTITIEWVADGGETTSIYWVGSFEKPTGMSGSFTSERDAAATDMALLASTDDTKEFTYENDTISYKVSALGTTTTVNLKKN